MQNYVIKRIDEEDLLKVELLCSLEDDKDLISDLQVKVKMYQGKGKILIDSYLALMYLVNGTSENLKLEAVRVLTKNGEIYYISTYDIKENRVILSDNSLCFMLNVLNYVNKQEKILVKVLDLKTLSYVDYNEDNHEKTLRKTKENLQYDK